MPRQQERQEKKKEVRFSFCVIRVTVLDAIFTGVLFFSCNSHLLYICKISLVYLQDIPSDHFKGYFTSLSLSSHVVSNSFSSLHLQALKLHFSFLMLLLSQPTSSSHPSSQAFSSRRDELMLIMLSSSPSISGEKDLIQSLVFDARATQIDPKKCGNPKTPSKHE